MEEKDAAAKESSNPTPIGYGKESVTVFGLGLSGALIWGIGIVPSIMALAKAKKAKRELLEAEGQLHGFGLIKAGVILAITGIFHFLLTIAMVFGLVWVVGQIPTWINDGLSKGTIAGVDVIDVLPNINLNDLGLDSATLNEVEKILPEGQTIDSLDLGALLDSLETTNSLDTIDPAVLEELGLNSSDLESLTVEDIIQMLESYQN